MTKPTAAAKAAVQLSDWIANWNLGERGHEIYLDPADIEPFFQRLLDEKDSDYDPSMIHCEQLETLCNRLCDEKEEMRAEIERLKQKLAEAEEKLIAHK